MVMASEDRIAELERKLEERLRALESALGAAGRAFGDNPMLQEAGMGRPMPLLLPQEDAAPSDEPHGLSPIRFAKHGGQNYLYLWDVAAGAWLAQPIPSEDTTLGFGDTPVTQAFGDSAAEGSSGNAARGDHKHGMPSEPAGWRLAGINSSEQSRSTGSAADLVTVSGLSIAAGTPFVIMVSARADAAASQACSLGLKLNTTTVQEADNGTTNLLTFAASASAVSGSAVAFIGPRETNYLRVATRFCGGQGGLLGSTGLWNLGAADMPTATITDVVIRAIGGGTRAIAVKHVAVYTLPTS